MDNQVCFRSDYFILFVVITLAIIMWVIYQINDKYTRTTMKLQSMYKDMINTEPEPRNIPEPPVANLPPPPPLGGGYIRSDNYHQLVRYGDYQLIGYVYPHRHPDQMFRLMGRRYDSYKYEYYVIHPYTDIKIPIDVKNNWELNTGDRVNIPGFKGHYIVHIYDTDRQIIP